MKHCINRGIGYWYNGARGDAGLFRFRFQFRPLFSFHCLKFAPVLK